MCCGVRARAGVTNNTHFKLRRLTFIPGMIQRRDERLPRPDVVCVDDAVWQAQRQPRIHWQALGSTDLALGALHYLHHWRHVHL